MSRLCHKQAGMPYCVYSRRIDQRQPRRCSHCDMPERTDGEFVVHNTQASGIELGTEHGDTVVKIRKFAQGVIGYWTTSNECLPTKAEAEEILELLEI